MQITAQITVDIDPKIWAEDYGMEESEVEADATMYYDNCLADDLIAAIERPQDGARVVTINVDLETRQTDGR